MVHYLVIHKCVFHLM